MLNALSVSLAGADDDGLQRAARSMERQGFVAALRMPWRRGTVEAWAHPSQRGVPDEIVQLPAGTACCVGPIWYRGRFGRAALALLIAEAAGGRPMDERELRGNYALFLEAQGRCTLVNDALGFVRIYSTNEGAFHSTSWLAACGYLGHVELDAGAAVEYVLLGASHSEQTVARGVTALPLGYTLDLELRGPAARGGLQIDVGASAPATLEHAVERISSHLRTVFTEVAAAFPGRTRAALSGGFDSRLILAGLLAVGAQPELFVYGAPASPDVRIAQAVAASVGARLSAIDKAAVDRGLPAVDLGGLEANALFFDGLPTDGVLDRGSDRTTRLAQTANGCLAMNGGGGEIFRNFFHLPDRTLRPIDVVRAFYRGFEPTVFRHPEDLARYQDRMVASMERVLAAVGAGSDDGARGRLARSAVELLYPLFRCHHWMAVNNSIAVRHGYYTTPLVDLNSVRLAAPLPLAWKSAGLLESRLITRLDRTVAAQPSAYGFRFTDGPDGRARRNEWAMGMRPAALRPLINAAQRRVHRVAVAPSRVREFRELLPGDWQVDPWLDLGRLPGDGALHRALSIEVVWRRGLTA